MKRRGMFSGWMARVVAVASVFGVIWGLSSRAEAAGEGTADALEKVNAQIRIIRDTKEPDEARTAYARGCTADRTSIGLHNIYMRKMLKFGLPQIAQYGARNLVGLDPANGLAWAVVGYSSAKQNKLNDAFASYVRAGELIESDASLAGNLGEIVAWQEKSRESAKITDDLEKRKEKAKKAYGKNKVYLDAYAKVAAAYAEYHRVAEEYDAKIKAAQGEYDKAEAEARKIDREMRQLYAKVEELKTRIRNLWSKYHGMERDPRWFPPDPDGNIPSQPINRRAYERDRQEIRDWIREAEKDKDQADKEYNSTREKGLAALKEMNARKKDLAAIQAEAKKEIAKVEPDMSWQPPAVDGVVTPEREIPVTAKAPSSSGGGGTDDPDKLLSLAKMYLANGLSAKAGETLQELLAKHPNSAEAKEARELLGQTPGQN